VAGTRCRSSIGSAAAALARTGELDAGHRALGESLRAVKARHMDYEVALTLRVVAELGVECDGVSPEDAATESRRILQVLGVEKTPDLLGMANA